MNRELFGKYHLERRQFELGHSAAADQDSAHRRLTQQSHVENLFLISFPVGAAFILKVILCEFISRRYLVLEQEDISQNYLWEKR